MAAATTTQGCRVSRKAMADTTMREAWAMRAARGPQRSAGQRTMKVMAVLASSVRVTAMPSCPASKPSSVR